MKARAGIVALVMLAACGSSAASPGTSPAPPRCGPPSATTLASSSQARVYSSHAGVFGCSFAQGRSFRLGGSARSIRGARAQPVALAGTDAGYGSSDFGVDTVRTQVVVRRLTDDKRLADFPASRAVGAESFQSVGSIAVKSDGAVAWIGLVHSIGGRGVIEVHAADASAGTDHVLDSGAQIVTPSLRLHGSTLTWQHGAATRHATLR